jgi:hypothetical protein
MKTFNGIVGILLLSSTLLFSCGDDDDNGGPQKTQEELATEELTGANGSQVWIIGTSGSVSKDGSLQTAEFADFEIRFISNNTGRSYTTTEGNLLFDASGSWGFEGSNLDKIILSGNQPAANKEISYTKNQDNLRLEFVIPAPENARVTALAGLYVFDLVLSE